MDGVIDVLESSLKHFEHDVNDSINDETRQHDGACFLKKENGLPPRAPPADVVVKSKKKLNKV